MKEKKVVLHIKNIQQADLNIATLRRVLDGGPLRGTDIAPLTGVISILEAIRDYKE